MRITIEFDTTEDALRALNSEAYSSSIYQFKEELRRLFKHWELTELQESVKDRVLRLSETYFGEFND